MLIKSRVIVLLALLLLGVAKSKDLDEDESIFHKFMKSRCIENAENREKGLQAFDVLKDSDETLLACVEHNINATEIEIDFTEADEKDNYTSLFHKYCKKRPVILECVDSFFKKLAVCYDKDLQEIQEILRKMIVAFMNFACDDDGVVFVNFIKEDSIECVRSRDFNTKINDCLEKNFDEYLAEDKNGEVYMPHIVLGEKQCNSIWNFENCVIDILDKSGQKNTLEAFNSLLRHIKKEAQYCKKYEIKKNHVEPENKI